MNREQIKVINTLSKSNVITLNGITAEVHPLNDEVLISNNPYEKDVKWDQMQVPYKDFIKTVEEHDGKFTCKTSKERGHDNSNGGSDTTKRIQAIRR